jgi:DNA polymerase-4
VALGARPAYSSEVAKQGLPRVILHLDMDAFYAAVEIREDPSLAGKPLIVGHRGRRGVVSTCSYEARKFGVRSAMPSLTAERLCPQAVWLPGRMALYAAVSHEIRAILDEFTPLVEPLSIDEAFLDLTGIASGLEAGRQTAQRIKDRIRREQRLTASVGVAPNKFLAKVASDLEKPDGLVVFPLEDVPKRLHPMPVERLWGVGPKTAALLKAASIRTIGDILAVPASRLERVAGSSLAAHLRDLARGEDDRPVETGRDAKSISEERTYAEDLTESEEIDAALLERAEGVARELRREGLVGRTVEIKIRTGDFKTWTRSKTLPEPTDLSEVIVREARRLLAGRIRLAGKGVRLIGVGMSSLEPAGRTQPLLFEDPAEERTRRLARAADEVRSRFGDDAIRRARLMRKGKGRKGPPPEASSLPSVD